VDIAGYLLAGFMARGNSPPSFRERASLPNDYSW